MVGVGVAASVILLAVGVIALTNGHDDADRAVETAETQQAIELAQRFIQGPRQPGTVTPLRALVADDAVIVGEDPRFRPPSSTSCQCRLSAGPPNGASPATRSASATVIRLPNQR